MPKNPYIHAAAATLYIVVLVTFIGSLNDMFGEGEETILVPMMMISLFVASAATMGYLFLSQPIMLYLDGSKKEAVQFFLKTLGSFAVFTILIILATVATA